VSAADAVATARLARACLDLTSLGDDEREGGDPAAFARLCERAQGPHGEVAAVCVWPRWAGWVRARLPRAIRVAAVANFPAGGTVVAEAVRETALAVDAGADEIDLVLPYRDLQAAPALLAAVRSRAGDRLLKVIVETGALAGAGAIASRMPWQCDAGADFLKTSTGKVAVNATPAATEALFDAIAADPGARERVGVKAAGGIRTVADAGVYLAIAARRLGIVTPRRFRIGASGLLDDIERVLGGTAAGGTAAAAY
jgi:deoxyribose-phosphate aldolase